MPRGVYKRTKEHRNAISEAAKNRKGKSAKPYYKAGETKRFCKKCGDIVNRRNKTGYCMHCFGEYNREKELWKYMTDHNSVYGIWNKGSKLSDETKKKISQTLKETSWWKDHGLHKSMTESECLFQDMFPAFEVNKHFGTGKDGKTKWKAGWFCVDFYDKDTNTAYEIDGSSHNLPGRQERDYRKQRFLESINIRVIRYPNEQIQYWSKGDYGPYTTRAI